MSKYAVMPIADYVSACDTIRSKTGGTEVIKSGKMAEQIRGVYDKGIEQGKQAEVKRWWTLYQRPSYNPFAYKYAGGTWNAKTFTPQFSDFVTGAGNCMFINNGVPNIKQAYAKTDCVLDISGCTSATQMFMDALTQELGIMDMSLLTASKTTMEMYAYNPRLYKIEKIICVAQTNFANSTFGGLPGLIEIRFEGEIGKSINFQWSTKLSVESIRSIINCLSSTTSGLSVTLSLTAVKKAFETSSGANDGNTSEEWLNLIATKPNWTINLV